MTNYITRPEGKAVDNQLPMQVDDVTQASDRVAAPVETVTFASGAKASSTGVNALDKAPILNLTGDKIGSYWEENKNKMYETARPLDIGTLTETATAADVAITDVDNNLELFFEIASGNRQYVLKAIDGDGNSLYGWIGGVAAASNVYTIDIHNAVTGGAQSWVGTLASFDATDVQRIEIYSYQSSFTWVTGTVLTEEVALPNEEALQSEKKMKEFYDTLSAGQYALNYRTGAIYFKKATTGTSDTCNYNTMASSSVTVSGSGSALTATDDSAMPATPEFTPVGGEYRASPTTYTDGDATVLQTNVNGALWTVGAGLLGASTYAEGTTGGVAVGAVRNDALAALADTDNELAPLQVDGLGALYVQGAYAEDAQHTSGDYGHQMLAVRNDAKTSLVGTDGDYAPFQVDVSGALFAVTGANNDHDNLVTGGAMQIGLEAKDFDGSALPNGVPEGDIVRGAGSGAGISYSMLVNGDGSSTPLATHDTAISAANGGNIGLMNVAEALTAQQTAVADGDAVRFAANEFGELVNAGYDWATQTNRVTEADPISSHHVEETLADLTNIAQSTTAYLYTDWDGYRYGTYQLETSGTAPTDTLTLTHESTCQDDGTAPASCTYQDTTQALFGVASVVDADTMWIIDTPLAVKYNRLKYVTSGGGGNDADLTVYHKRMY